MIGSTGSYGSYYQMNNDAYGNYYDAGFNADKAYGSINESAEGVGQVKKTECQTCKNRKYVDGSDEANVSFKTPSHIPASMSAAAVSSHEAEHVSNAVKEGNEKGKKLLSVSVSLKTAICPECGRVYTAGGTTRTTMLSEAEEEKPENPYEAGRNLVMRYMAQGQNIDAAV